MCALIPKVNARCSDAFLTLVPHPNVVHFDVRVGTLRDLLVKIHDAVAQRRAPSARTWYCKQTRGHNVKT